MSATIGLRTRKGFVGLVAVGALAAAAAMTVSPAAAANKDGFARAPSGQLRPTGTVSVSKAKAGRSGGASALAAVAGGPEPAPASCVDVTVAPGSNPAGGYIPLSTFGTTPIAGVGDDTITNFNVPAFSFNGIPYTSIGISSNGYVQLAPTSATSFINQNLPDSAAPNGILAPFWTDLNPGAAGAVLITTLTDGADSWIVVEWDAVREFSTTRANSFQIWIGISGDANPGEDVSYVYGPIGGNGDGGFLTVGAENNTGTGGETTYYNGTGTLPSNGTQLRVSSGGGGPVSDFSATPAAGDAGQSVAFDGGAARDDGSITAYDWDFGDGSTGTGETTSHVYAPGSYTATLKVTDNDGNACTASRQITSNGAFSVSDASVNESAGTATFSVTRLGGEAASVDVSASPGTARTPADFSATPQTLVFASGELTKTFDVAIVQDALDENNETFTVALTNASNGGIADGSGRGTIVDDDAPVRITVNDVNITEGNSGTSNLTFTVRLNRASGRSVSVRAQTADGSARAPSDYAAKTVTLTFYAGQTAKTVAISVKGDRIREPNETMFLLLDRPTNATISDASGTGGIINND